jgi:hypothetical protein
MKINQPSSRTIKVVTESGTSFFLSYRFSWNGHDREPASVVLETTGLGLRAAAEVKAFFLFGMVKDTITEDADGIRISRSWNVMTPGAVKIFIDVEFDVHDEPVCLFPGVHVARGLPSSAVSFLGERTSYPAALILSLGDEAAAVFSRSVCSGKDALSIGVSRTDGDEEPARLRVEVRFPGVEEPASRTGPRPEHRVQPGDPVIVCSESLERTHELFLAFSPRHRILETTSAAVFRRLPFSLPPKPPVKSVPELASLSSAAQLMLSTHLLEDHGVAGLREVPGSPWLSSTAGMALAVSLRRLYPGDERTGEIALRLADFSLKGQLPSGLFYESYDEGKGEWRGVRGKPARAMLSIPHSARIAELLLVLAEDLEKEGLPFEKYFIAGQRFVDLFVNERGRCALPGNLCPPSQVPVFDEGDRRDARSGHSLALDAEEIGVWEVFFPLARVLDRLGKDRYKKALGVIAARFSSVPWDIFNPPTTREGRDPESAAALLVVRLFVELRRRGYRPAEPSGSGVTASSRATQSVTLFASLLFPWIRMHGDAGGLDGTLVDSFARQRLLFAGNETAYLLRRLEEIADRRDLKSLLALLARLCLASGRGVAPGTAFFQHTRWDEDGRETATGKIGPVDSRRLASELLYALMSATHRSSSKRLSGQSVPGARFRKPSGRP